MAKKMYFETVLESGTTKAAEFKLHGCWLYLRSIPKFMNGSSTNSTPRTASNSTATAIEIPDDTTDATATEANTPTLGVRPMGIKSTKAMEKSENYQKAQLDVHKSLAASSAKRTQVYEGTY
jgi:hypothetical protein